MYRKPVISAVVVAALVVGGCDSPTSSRADARLTVLLTDAPHDFLESAVVEIGRVEVVRAGGPPIVVATDVGEFDLLELQNGITATLGSVDVEPGRYLQLRLFVNSASVTLRDGFQFTDGSTTRVLAVPSGAQSGIKVLLRSSGGNGNGKSGAGIEIRPGETTLVVDFDVSLNFVMLGSPHSPAGIQGFLFKPVLRAVVDDLSGSIAGSVAAPAGVATAGLSVTATRDGAEQDEPPVTTLVKEDGTFKLHFVTAGTYDITVAVPPTGHTANTVQKSVIEAEHVTGVEIVISPA